jgi:hypothetical protein
MTENLNEQFLNEISAVEIAQEVIEDFRSLNQILFKLQEDFSLPGDRKKLREMSAQTDEEIRPLMGRIAGNIRKLNGTLRKEVHVLPHDKEDMDRAMIRIMNQYMAMSVSIQLDASKGELYAAELNEIHSSLKELSDALNGYNEMAKVKGWPELMSENEACTAVRALQKLPIS